MDEKAVGTEDLLENFRRQWETEISAARSRSSRNKPQSFQDEKQETGANKENTDEEQATDMYLCGVKHEESGEFVEAIKFYKKAMQLVPDIEQRIYTYPKNKENSTNISTKSAESLEKVPLTADNNNLDDSDEGTVNLLEKFQRILQQGGRICIPEDESKGTHISALPREIFRIRYTGGRIEKQQGTGEQTKTFFPALNLREREGSIFADLSGLFWHPWPPLPHVTLEYPNNKRDIFPVYVSFPLYRNGQRF